MLLLIGGNSEIGAATARYLAARGERAITTTRRLHEAGPQRLYLDLERLPDDWQPPADVTAACIFVAVARLAACAADPAGSTLVNVTRTLMLAKTLVSHGIYTVFLSTNQVFDGSRAHVPADAPPSPVSAYGHQKAAAEDAFKSWIAEGAPAAILRLAKVVSPDMALIHGWRRQLTAGERISAFADMTLAPAPVAMVAEAIGRMLEDRRPMIAQLTGGEDVTYASVARFVAERTGSDPTLVAVGQTSDKNLPPGSAPPNTTLDSTYLADRYGMSVPGPWSVIGSILDAPPA